MDFTEAQLQRYARHIVLPEVGGIGQAKLLESSVLVVGAGGLGAPLILYLAAAGVGRIGIIDDDEVALSNLQRQVIHSTADIGRPKVESARDTVGRVNPEVKLEAHRERLTAKNVAKLIAGYDLVADGTDNFETRFLLTDACHLGKRTLVSAAILRFEGQIATFKSHLGAPYPCYRCLYREPPPPGMVPSCAEGGVFGALAGVMGSLQAVETIKEIIGAGETLAGSLLIYDALEVTFRKMKLPRDPECPLCGPQASIRNLSGHLAHAGA